MRAGSLRAGRIAWNELSGNQWLDLRCCRPYLFHTDPYSIIQPNPVNRKLSIWYCFKQTVEV